MSQINRIVLLREDEFEDIGMMTIFYALELYGDNSPWCDESHNCFELISVIGKNNEIDTNVSSACQKMTNSEYVRLYYFIECAKGYASWEKCIEFDAILNLLIDLRPDVKLD